jgi:rhodanese-related sulfurtransferase
MAFHQTVEAGRLRPPDGSDMTGRIELTSLRASLRARSELALLDIREYGQFGDAHIFAAVPLPYSRLELGIRAIVPNPAVPVVLCGDGDGIVRLAANRLAGLGYSNVDVLEGGPADWRNRGLELFEGVNTVSKAFGELVDHICGTPRIAPEELYRRLKQGDNVIVVDGRPLSEYTKMNIPGSICCPNGELALRIGALAPDPATTIVVNCAGRTRSILGAQTLIDLGIPNRVAALENGTQGWFLAGLPLEHGATRRYSDLPPVGRELETLRGRTRALMERYEVPRVDAPTVDAWRSDATRTTYLFDIRTRAEFEAEPMGAAIHAPGGQLLQATDQWVGVRGARIVLLDQDGVRAGVIAKWLRQIGYETWVLERGDEDRLNAPVPTPMRLINLPDVAYASTGDLPILDLRPSMVFRAGHAPGARWSIRPRVANDAAGASRIGIIGEDRRIAALAAIDLSESGVRRVFWIPDAPTTDCTPDDPPNEQCIDHVFFTDRRHEGDRDAAQQYLEWETNLVNRLTADERTLFAV